MVSLDTIGLRTGTDKSSAHHNYLHTYEKYFAPLRDKNILLFEAGVGGYQYANRGGESLRMWCDYFKQGRVVTIDLYDKTQIVTPNNAEVYKCSQTVMNYFKRKCDEVNLIEKTDIEAVHFYKGLIIIKKL